MPYKATYNSEEKLITTTASGELTTADLIEAREHLTEFASKGAKKLLVIYDQTEVKYTLEDAEDFNSFMRVH